MSRTSDARARLYGAKERNELDQQQMAEQRGRFEKIKGRHENGSAPVAVSSFNLFPTPVPLARRLVDLAKIEAGHSVLEPSAGTGRLLDSMPYGCRITAVEISAELCKGLYERYPQVLIKRGDFLARSFGSFDRIVMNPPFCRGADIKHIRHAMAHLKPGGRLVTLCAWGKNRFEAFEDCCESWEQLQPGSFKSEGTHVDVALMVLTKAAESFKTVEQLKAEDREIERAEAAQKGA